ncbi:outer membrane protein assembly factor BamE [Gallaecimonas kandeliae]|uniref:outer membrane protein assembly factor BamE n=1 Tax=Gallaecimonas kandeliae TaxID=3029055 RepID=UPI002647F16D|nr:outer membrane protein assembly factor BamE [Gallaecimonas kandeliae]WKE66557.1 outer membrane protein assembly factor BamE [Gallaecimonas kandeliae]
MKNVLLALTLGLGLSGCGLVYKIDVPQGNYLEQDQINKLQPGMSHEQVSYVLGTPLLKDSFKDGTWYYKYSYRPGRGKVVEKQVVVHFDKAGKLAGIEAPDFKVPDTLKAKAN